MLFVSDSRVSRQPICVLRFNIALRILMAA